MFLTIESCEILLVAFGVVTTSFLQLIVAVASSIKTNIYFIKMVSKTNHKITNIDGMK